MPESSSSQYRWIHGILAPGKRSSPAARFGAILLSVLYSLKRRRLNRFYWDKDGAWVNRQCTHTVFSPSVRLVDQVETRNDVFDQWLYRYRPKPGDVVVDVGAGIGEETIYFSRMVGAEGRVISIEAHPGTFACLQKTIRSNKLSNVTAIHCAVSDAEGQTPISDDAVDIENTIIDTDTGVLVASKTLDSILEPHALRTIHLLKMNIEGAERLALAGMSVTVAHTENLCISCHDFLGPHMQSRNEVTGFLQGCGYEIYRRDRDHRPWVRDYVYATRAASP